MTTDSPTMTPDAETPEIESIETEAIEAGTPESMAAAPPDETADAPSDETAAPPPPAPPKVKAITWETERNAAAAALARAGATPREVRVLASNAARAASAMRPAARYGPVDLTVLDDKAAETVLAEHRAAASPAWSQ